jgi:uncharacterized protein (TIGR01777 family)
MGYYLNIRNDYRMHILITGGTGFIGSELRPMLLQQGHYLNIITRNPQQYRSERAKNQQFTSWDDDLITAMGTADAVINLAGEPIFGQRWTAEVKRRMYASRVKSTKKLVKAIKRVEQPPEVMISASAVGYYGSRGEVALSEEEPSGNDFLAQICANWEYAAQSVQETGIRLAIPRFGIALETGGGALKYMLPPFKFFLGGYIGQGTQYFPWIHRHDLCRGLMFALENKDFEGPFNLNAPNPVTMDEFASAVGDVMNRPAIFRIPESFVETVLGEAAGPIVGSLRARPTHLKEAGFEFQFKDVREALSEIL